MLGGVGRLVLGLTPTSYQSRLNTACARATDRQMNARLSVAKAVISGLAVIRPENPKVSAGVKWVI